MGNPRYGGDQSRHRDRHRTGDRREARRASACLGSPYIRRHSHLPYDRYAPYAIDNLKRILRGELRLPVFFGWGCCQHRGHRGHRGYCASRLRPYAPYGPYALGNRRKI
jgi:hypothetical protein